VSNLGLQMRPVDPPPPRRRRRRTLGILAVLGVAALLVAGLAVGAGRLLTAVGRTPNYSGPGTGSAVVQVHTGDSLTAIGQALTKAEVVKSEAAFKEAAKAEPRAQSVQPGWYRLRQHMSGTAAAALLLNPSAKIKSKVVVPEGTRLSGVLDLISKSTEISLPNLNAAAANPAALGIPPYANGLLEGFLYPATYEFGPDTTAADALRAMVARFVQEATDANLVSGSAAIGRTPYEVITVASLVEKEARVPDDYSKVAQVAYNRLLPSWNKPLGFDSTINYALPERQGDLRTSDLAVDSPYNSRTHKGLPPTPINSPGRAALDAALHPTPGPWTYFVTIDKSGHAAFSDTQAQFDKDVATSRANGVK
jgi:UPF0755 protein